MIIILTQCFPPKVGGIESLVFNISYFLSKHEKIIVLADQKDKINDSFFDKNCKVNFLVKRIGGIKFFRRRKKAKELNILLTSSKVKCVIADSWKSFELPIHNLNKFNIPTICLAHGNEIITKNRSHFNRIYKTLNMVNSIVCNSNFTHNLINKFSLTSPIIKVIYPGVANLDKIREEKIENIIGNPILLTLARLEKRKGHKYILNCIQNLKKDYPDIKYVIVGHGSELNNLKKLVKDNNITDNVLFIRSINDNQKKYLFSKTDLMVMTTLDESHNNSIEGFGISYIEAALFNIPSIASKVGGTSEAVIHNKTGIILDNIEQIEFAIRDLIKNKEKKIKLGREARKRVIQELQWDNQIKKYINLISEIIN